MISWHAYLLFLGVYAVVIATPGPGVMAIAARALGSGFQAVLPMILGTVAGDMTLMTFSVFGLAALAKAMGGLFVIVKLSGAVYLVYLGYRYWKSKDLENDAKTVPVHRSFLAQYALSLGNPNALAFWVALLPSIVDMNTLNPAIYGQLSLAIFVLPPAITAGYAAIASRIRGVLTGITARRRLNRGVAVIMIGAGIGVAAN
jgi:threonine/homoserine/homoserine lactone efflux protein